MKFYVKAEKECPNCSGRGYVIHWLWQWYHSENSDYDNVDRWFAENGFDEVPNEEIECPECDGRGSVITEIDLKQALEILQEETHVSR